jgi:hypothetical protein
MRLDPFIRDYRGFIAEFVGAIEAEGTLFYLDTSLLIWLLRVGAKVRAEFIRWCNTRPSNAVRVPVWAAHELHQHVIAGTVLSSVKKTLSDAQTKYDEFARLASERADDAVCLAKGYTGRESYVGEVEQSIVRFGLLKRVVELDEEQLHQAAEEVIDFVNTHVMASDIRPIIRELSLTGSFRSGHRVPPGFHDKKEENRFGDVIIWEEIVEDLLAAGHDSSGQSRHVVFVSRDDKTDWATSAPFVRNIYGAAQRSIGDQELDVVLAHPLLVHEFAHRAHGNRIYIAHPSLLASAIDFGTRQGKQQHDIAQWFAASHRTGLLKRLATIELAKSIASIGGDATNVGQGAPPPAPVPPESTIPRAPLPPGAVPPGNEFTLAVQDAVGVMSSAIATEIQQYWEAVPIEQPVLITEWVTQVRQGDLQPYKFGRILAELSTRSSQGFSELLPAVIEQLANTISRELLNEVVLALMTSAYFDRYGQLLRRPYGDLGRLVLALETDMRLKPALSALSRLLTEAGAHLPYLPGSGRKRVLFNFDLVEGSSMHTVRDIRIGGHSAFAYPIGSHSRRRLSVFLARTPTDGCTGKELRILIAREFLIPADLLDSNSDKKKLTWLTDAGLVILDMEVEGGLSALADEEDKDDWRS